MYQLWIVFRTSVRVASQRLGGYSVVSVLGSLSCISIYELYPSVYQMSIGFVLSLVLTEKLVEMGLDKINHERVQFSLSHTR